MSKSNKFFRLFIVFITAMLLCMCLCLSACEDEAADASSGGVAAYTAETVGNKLILRSRARVEPFFCLTEIILKRSASGVVLEKISESFGANTLLPSSTVSKLAIEESEHLVYKTFYNSEGKTQAQAPNGFQCAFIVLSSSPNTLVSISQGVCYEFSYTNTKPDKTSQTVTVTRTVKLSDFQALLNALPIT